MNCSAREAPTGAPLFTAGISTKLVLIFNTAPGEDALLVGVFYFAHLGHRVGQFDERRVSVAAGEDDVQHLRLAAERAYGVARLDETKDGHNA
jgi:hypothetical protein